MNINGAAAGLGLLLEILAGAAAASRTKHVHSAARFGVLHVQKRSCTGINGMIRVHAYTYTTVSAVYEW